MRVVRPTVRSGLRSARGSRDAARWPGRGLRAHRRAFLHQGRVCGHPTALRPRGRGGASHARPALGMVTASGRRTPRGGRARRAVIGWRRRPPGGSARRAVIVRGAHRGAARPRAGPPLPRRCTRGCRRRARRPCGSSRRTRPHSGGYAAASSSAYAAAVARVVRVERSKSSRATGALRASTRASAFAFAHRMSCSRRRTEVLGVRLAGHERGLGRADDQVDVHSPHGFEESPPWVRAASAGAARGAAPTPWPTGGGHGLPGPSRRTSGGGEALHRRAVATRDATARFGSTVPSSSE